jgi:hypothetical protein
MNVRDAFENFTEKVGRPPENDDERFAAVAAYILKARGSLDKLGLQLFPDGRIKVRPLPKPRKPQPRTREALLARAKKARPYEEYYG